MNLSDIASLKNEEVIDPFIVSISHFVLTAFTDIKAPL